MYIPRFFFYMEHTELKNGNQIPGQDIMLDFMLSVAERTRKGGDLWTLGIKKARKSEDPPPHPPMLVSGSMGPRSRNFWLLGDDSRKKISAHAFSRLRSTRVASGRFWFHVKPPTGEFEYFASWGPTCGRGNKGILSITDGKRTFRLTEFSIS